MTSSTKRSSVAAQQPQGSPFPAGGNTGTVPVRAGSKTRCGQWSAVSRGLPRVILKWIILLSHMYSTEGLSQLRHQQMDAGVNTTTASIVSHWSEYGLWTACSTTCGYGIQHRDRNCLNERNEYIDASFCSGSTRQYKVCTTDVQCPSYTGFRVQQCSAHNELGLFWKPYIGHSVGACQVACYTQSRTGRVSRVLDQLLPNGMLCSSYRGCDWWNRVSPSKGVCLQGQCVDFGCDGILNSTKVHDSCGVCGGDGSSCQVLSARFTDILQVGYTEVVEIPAGAHNIKVYEVEKSSNHLAITDDSENPILNGLYQIGSPGRYDVAGTTANYKRCGASRYSPGHYEEITIQAATSVKILIWIASAQKDSQANVAYQYSLPLPTQQTPRITATPTPVTPSQPDTTESLTTPKTEKVDPTAVTSRVEDRHDLPNVIAINTLPYDNSRDTDADFVTQGTADQLPDLLPDADGISDSEHNTSETKQNTSSVTKPIGVEKSEMFIDVLNSTQDPIEMQDAQTLEELQEKLLSQIQNSSLPQEMPLVPAAPIDWFAEAVENQYQNTGKISSQDNVRRDETDNPDVRQDITQISGDLEDGWGRTTLEPIMVNTNSYSHFVPEVSKPPTPGTAPHIPLEPEEPTNSTMAGSSPRPSSTNESSHYHENDLLVDDRHTSVATSRDESSILTSVSPISTARTPTQRTVKAAELDDFQDLPFEYHPGIGDSSELLFGEVPQIMELINPSMETRDPAVQPSVAAATSVVISRGDVPVEDWQAKLHYLWAKTGVAPCSATCSRGMSRSYAYCTLQGEQVPDNLCDPASKPEVVERECGGRICQPRWAVGSWSQCTVSCGTGSIYRTVHCWLMIGPGLDTSISNTYCNQSNVPDSVRSCSLSPCGPQWQTSDWSECSVQCGEGVQTREVRCSVEDGTCNSGLKPPATKRCMVQTCPSQWTTSQWTACRGHCTIMQHRRVDCVNPDGIIVTDSACPASGKPLSHSLCGKGCPAQWVAQSFDPCRGECGSTVRRRKVVCAATSPITGHMQVLADSVCEPSQKPNTESSCQLVSCQPQVTRHRRQSPQWLTTPWSVCSVSCGSGQRTRQISCNRRRNHPHLNCNENKKPRISEPCTMGECPAFNPACSDSPIADCNLIRRANLCRYDSYKKSCCLSCSP